MTLDSLKKGKKLETELDRLGTFLSYCKCNRHIRLFKKKIGISVTVSDYMRETKLFKLSNEQRDKFIAILQEEYNEKKKELEQLQ